MVENGKMTREGREGLHKVSISRIKKEMSDVFYLSDDLVITTLTADKNTTANYPTSIDGFTAIIMMVGEAVVSIDMQNYTVRPNTIVFFNPDSIIRTVKCSSNAAAYLLAFSKSFVNEIQIDLSTSLPVYMRFGKAPVLEVTQQDVDEIRLPIHIDLIDHIFDAGVPEDGRDQPDERARRRNVVADALDLHFRARKQGVISFDLDLKSKHRVLLIV